MNVSCEIHIRYDDEKMAKAVFDSLKMDNDKFVRGEIRGKELFFSMNSSNPMSLYHTANDLLACLKAAENSIRASSSS